MTELETAAEDASESEGPYTVGERIIHVEGDTGRPEVFIETSLEDVGPATDVSLLRDSDALELYEQLGDYLRSEGLVGDGDE